MAHFTVQDIAREVIQYSDSPNGLLVAAQMVSNKLQELYSMGKGFRSLRKMGQLYLPAPITNGTVTVTLNSPYVVGDSAANQQWSTTPGAPDSLIGQWFRAKQGTVWSRIVEIDSSTNPSSWTIILETPYAQDNQGAGIFANGSVVSGLAYYIIPRYVDIAPDARQVGTVVLDAMYRPLVLKSEDELNWLYASRFLVAFPPWCYAVMNSDLDSTDQPKVLEFYPYPQTSATVHYTYWQTPTVLSMTDPVPPTIDKDILRTGAMAEFYAKEAARMARIGQVESAGFFRNIANQEETKFQNKVSRAIRNDRGADDLKFIVSTGNWKRGTAGADYDPVQTAYQNYLARGY